MSKFIAHIVVGLPVEGPFDYSIPEELRGRVAPGCRVLISFAGQKRVGFVVSLAGHSDIPKLSPLLDILDEEPIFSQAALKLSLLFALHFGCSQGEALELFLPVYLRKSRLFKRPETRDERRETRDGDLSPLASRPSPLKQLVFDPGLTKRWDAVLPRIRETLAQGRGVICLIPDGSFGPGVLPRLASLVDAEQFVVIRKGTEKEESERWLKIRRGTARLVAGCISAVFAPVQDLGLIVIFDEESAFYKHDQSPFYHARETAFFRQHTEGCDVLCVSSAPSVELWHDVVERKHHLIRMEDAQPPVKLLDLTNFKMKRDTLISPGLGQHIESVLKEGKKVLLYIQAAKGSVGVVEELRKRFPGALSLGYEKTSTALPARWDILVATQAVFRHRASLRVALSCILDIDWEFHKTDYRAAHGAFALLQHIRQMTTGLTLLQTRQVHQEYLHLFTADDYETFYQKELHHRRDAGLPPYAWLVALVVRSTDPVLACAEAKRLYDVLCAKRPEDIGVLEPQPDRSAIVRGKFRHCVMVHGLELKEVMGFIKEAMKGFRGKKDVVVTVNVNP